jgi:FKBP-type peptidyl-prolyl cis-trans isomerase SlyD
MKVEDRTVVTLAYTLRLDNNEIVDEATRQEPFEYVHGAQSIVPGLERALSGLEPGQKRQIVVEPEDGYGEYEEGAIIEVPLTLFPADIEPEVGMGVYLQSADGEPMPYYISAVEEDVALLDANHPLAGERLHFDVEVLAVRRATAEEVAHGHVHAG